MKIEQVDNTDISLCEASLLHRTSWLASLRTYSVGYPGGTLSLTFQPGLSAKDLATLSTDGITAGCQIMHYSTKFPLLDGRQSLKAMRSSTCRVIWYPLSNASRFVLFLKKRKVISAR